MKENTHQPSNVREQTMKASVCTEPGQHVALVKTNTEQMNSFQQGFKISH